MTRGSAKIVFLVNTPFVAQDFGRVPNYLARLKKEKDLEQKRWEDEQEPILRNSVSAEKKIVGQIYCCSNA
jgi:flagellar motility protein MotE (MotC chaperone)